MDFILKKCVPRLKLQFSSFFVEVKLLVKMIARGAVIPGMWMPHIKSMIHSGFGGSERSC